MSKHLTFDRRYVITGQISYHSGIETSIGIDLSHWVLIVVEILQRKVTLFTIKYWNHLCICCYFISGANFLCVCKINIFSLEFFKIKQWELNERFWIFEKKEELTILKQFIEKRMDLYALNECWKGQKVYWNHIENGNGEYVKKTRQPTKEQTPAYYHQWVFNTNRKKAHSKVGLS